MRQVEYDIARMGVSGRLFVGFIMVNGHGRFQSDRPTNHKWSAIWMVGVGGGCAKRVAISG